MGVIDAVSNSPFSRLLKAALLSLLLWPIGALSSDEAAERLGVPSTRQLSAALADPGSRIDTLLTMA